MSSPRFGLASIVLAVTLCLPLCAQSPFLGMDAAVAAAGAPDWLQEGTRLSFRVSSASPNETGERLGAAATGVLQMDVTSLAQGKASGVLGNWTQVQPANGASGGWALIGTTGFSTPAGYGEYWVHPKVLDQALESLKDSDFWKVARGPYQADGKTVQAVMFTGSSADGRLVLRYVYDAKTGVALFMSSAQRKNRQADLLPVAVTEFLVRRERKFPWTEGRPPAWLTKYRRYVYDGRQVTSIPNAYETQLPTRIIFEVSDRGPNWIGGQLKQESQGYAAQSVYRLSGGSASSGFWLPPLGVQSAAKRFQGQAVEIDRDPVTGAVISIAFAGQSQHGRNVVTIQEQTSGYASWSDFEIETGILILFTSQTYAMSSTFQVWLTGLE